MRVVLAIAERYQPKSVKPRSVSEPKPYPGNQPPSGSYLPDSEASNRTPVEGHVTANNNQPGDHMTLTPVASAADTRPFVRTWSGMKSNSTSVPNINGLSSRVFGGNEAGGFGSAGSLGGVGRLGDPEGTRGGIHRNHSQLVHTLNTPPGECVLFIVTCVGTGLMSGERGAKEY